jgi:hypothetical protein
MLENGFSITYSHFWGSYNYQKIISYSYNIQLRHILVSWNPLENGDKTCEKNVILVSSVKNDGSKKSTLPHFTTLERAQ